MGLMDRLREAEQQGKQAARQAYERAREMGEDAQRRIRQKMRIYPRPAAATPSEVSQSGPTGAVPAAAESVGSRPLEAEPSQPIVSIRGRDVEGNLGERKIA